jgi:cation transport ATPase
MKFITVFFAIFLLSACARHYSHQPRVFRLGVNHSEEKSNNSYAKQRTNTPNAIAAETQFEVDPVQNQDTFSPIPIVRHFEEHLIKTPFRRLQAQPPDSVIVKQNQNETDSLMREKAIRNTSTISQFALFGILNALLIVGGSQVFPLYILIGALMAFVFIYLIVQVSEGVFEIRDRMSISRDYTKNLRNNFLKVVVLGLLLILLALLFSLIGSVSFSFVPFIFASIFGTAGVIMLFVGLIGLLVSALIPKY